MSQSDTDINLKGLLECLLFVHQEPLKLSEICRVYQVETKDLSAALEALAAEYDNDPTRGLQIVEVAGGYQMRTRAAYGEEIRIFFKAKPQRLSHAALETLAMVAYRQPVMRSEIEKVRGVDCGGTLRNLLDRGLVKIHGKKELPGRPLIYTTTKKFLEVFNLSALSQLPTLKELSEIEGGPPNLNLFPDEHFGEEERDDYEPIDTQEPPPSRLAEEDEDSPHGVTYGSEGQSQPEEAEDDDNQKSDEEKLKEENDDGTQQEDSVGKEDDEREDDEYEDGDEEEDDDDASDEEK